ncbi:MAG: hypothetical protein ACW98A_16745 [Candidatus Hodarchaeales archaeon]|jgi:hypothetical protein
MTFSYYVDKSLLEFDEYFSGTFEAIEKLTHHGHFRFYFSRSNKSKALLDDLQADLAKIHSLGEDMGNNFLNEYEKSKISFSWGIEDHQYIFIIITEGENYLLKTPVALIGLMLHELMHGVERIRGLEDDLNRSMKFTQEFFEGFMKLLPQYPKEELQKTLVSIAQIAIYVLKEWYCNRELIERDFTAELLYYYEVMFGLNESIKTEKLPVLEITLPDNPEPGTVNLEDFTNALNFFMSLTSAYIPFLRMHSATYGHTTAEKIKRFIHTRYPHLQSVARELKHLEDLYLTEFTYTKDFHRAFYTGLFSLVYRYLGGQTFLIWHYVDIVNGIEQLPDFQLQEEDSSLIEIVMIPVLKAAHIFCRDVKITPELEKGLQEKMRKYMSVEELEEWNSSWFEFDMNKLLLLPLQHLVEELRGKFLKSIQELRKYTKLILKILNLLSGEENEEICKEWRSLVLKFISERDSRFDGLKILLPLEFSIKSFIFKDSFELTSSEAKEALFLFRYYAVPKTNYHINVLIKVARLIKFGMSKVDFEKPEDAGQALAMTVSMFLVSEENFQDVRFVHIIFKLLLETLEIPVKVGRIASKTFGGLLQSQENIDEEEVESIDK